MKKFNIDIVLLSIFFMLGLSVSYWGSNQITYKITQTELEAFDVYYQADIPWYYDNMTDRWSNHNRTDVHPLFSIVSNPIIYVMRSIHISEYQAVRIWLSIVVSFWFGSVFILFRLMGLFRMDAVIFSLVAGSSAATIFWSPVPETFVLGSLTIIFVFCIAASNKIIACSQKIFILCSAVSLSITITNWMTGIFFTFLNCERRKAIQISINAIMLVTIIWSIQSQIYPSARYFLGNHYRETRFIMHDYGGGFKDKLQVFFFHSMVMPQTKILENPHTNKWPYLSIQKSKVGSSGLIGKAALVCWVILLSSGIWAFFYYNENRKIKTLLWLTLLGQLCLHLIFGEELFLYTMHWMPLLVIISSWTTFSPFRKYTLIIASVLVLLLIFNNFKEFLKVVEILNNSII